MEKYNILKGNFEDIIMRLVAALLLAGIPILVEDKNRFTSLDSIGTVPSNLFLVTWSIIFIFMTIVRYFIYRVVENNYDALFLIVAVSLYGIFIALNTTSIYYIAIVALFAVLAIRFGIKKMERYVKFSLSDRRMKFLLLLICIVTLVYLLSLVVLRVFLLKPVTFDYGIFLQAFYYMKKCLIPFTTCERFELLSHFTVHFSPIFYLILPFYALFPTEYTLVVIQLIAVLSGVIPVYLICRNKKLANIPTLALCITYLLYPTLRGGLFYDFHENKFLAPLVLWLLYFFELKKPGKKKMAGIIIFTALILMVKEDAAIYTGCIGLFMLFYKKNKRDKITSAVIMVVSVIYFFVVFHFMGIYGDAGSAITSFGRYENLMVSEFDGVGGLVMNMLKNPAYVLGELLDAEKVEFVLWMFLPVMFLPFKSRKISNYILIVPMIVLNLLSDYKYQHIIYFQYAYASGVFIIYLSIIEMKKLNQRDGKNMAIAMVVASVLLSTAAISDRNVYYADYKEQKSKLIEARELIDTIPKEKSVSATTTYVPALADRDEVYRFTDGDRMDYLVFSITEMQNDANMAIANKYLEDGYHVYGKVEGRVIVLEKNN